MTIDGSVAFDFADASCSASGTYVISTTSDITIDPFTDSTVSGVVEVNDVTLTFNSDGTITVSYSGGTLPPASESAIVAECTYDTMGAASMFVD